MVDFSTAQYDSVTQQIESALSTLQQKITGVPGTVDAAIAHWWITDGMKSFIRMVGNKIVEFGNWLWRTVKDILKGIAAPIYMAMKAWDWYEIRSTVTQIAADTNPGQSKALREWQGSAASSYQSSGNAQNSATKRIGEIADKAATVLATVAAAGLAFYAAILALLEKAIAAITSAIVALGTGVFSAAGLALLLEEAGTQTVSITGLVTAISALVSAQAAQMLQLKSAVTDNSAFPFGKWPDPESSTFDNASRLGGTAPWSVK